MILDRLSNRGWIILYFAIAFGAWGGRPLWAPDEGRYAEVAREMIASGDWIMPHLSGHAHLTKPPFTYWITAIGMEIFGQNEWGARFFLSLAFFGAILCVREIGRTWGWNELESHMAGLVFGTSVLSYACGHVLTTDMFLTFWETLGILSAWKVWKGIGRLPVWRIVFWTAFGMAFLTKGPPGWIPLAVILAYLAARPNRTPHGRLLISPLGIAAMVIISGGWFAALIWQDHTLLAYFLKNETYNRIFTTEHRRNNPFWMYIPTLVLGSLPWTCLWAEIYRRARARLGLGWRNLSDIQQFTVLWFSISFAVFTLARSRLALYVVPMSVSLALWEGKIAAGWLLPKLAQSIRLRRSAYAVAGLIGAAMILMTVYPVGWPASKTCKSLAMKMRQWPELSSPNTSIYWISDDPNQTLAFYCRALVYERDMEHENAPRFGDAELAAGRQPIFVTRVSRAKKFKRNPKSMGRVADDGKNIAILYRPVNTPQAGQGATAPD
ncbi:glycosyltransferase family 39 protein [Candidatus Sumerlaeota bacterium]|nr:glycosyltransferase family 39 protein [Candidatus Sumerlaeota bacterium]